MIGLALSGGGARAMAFHLGCLRALSDRGILDRIGVLSTISGGSVIGAYYAYTPEKSFQEFDADIRSFLRNGFQRSLVAKLANPVNLLRCGSNLFATKLEWLVSLATKHERYIHRYPSRTDLFQEVLRDQLFANLKMSAPTRNHMEIVIGACELRKGVAFRFGKERSGDWRHGEVVGSEIDVGFAVGASAAYPIMLPALDREWLFRKGINESYHRVLITDGGVYDNLGTQVLEPGRDSKVSLHTYPCEYLIVCNAGHGQEAGHGLPLGFSSRVARSFEVVHRRVQDAAMQRLYTLKSAGLIKGFIMPYLGQQDSGLGFKPAGFVPRDNVVGYPTDFAAMSEEWIERLVARGDLLTRMQLDEHLPFL